MKSKNVIILVTVIFLAAAGVVVYVLHRTDVTLKNAQVAADKAQGVIGDVQGLGSGLKKVWSDIQRVL